MFQMIKDPETASERLVNRLLASIEGKAMIYPFEAFAELASGMIAVFDAQDEIDVVFDLSLWAYKHPDAWLKNGAFPHLRPELGFGVLPGVGTVPKPRTFDDALAYAHMALEMLPLPAWCSAPKAILIRPAKPLAA